MPNPDPLITTRWMDYSYSAQRGVIVLEISGTGINSGPVAIAKCGRGKGDAFPDDASLKIQDIEAIRLSPINFWRVTYSYAPDGANTGDRDSNLLGNPPKYQWGIGVKQEPIDRDKDGNAITNSAGDPFENGADEPFPLGYLTIKRYESAPFNFQDRWNFVGKVNDGDMTIQGHSIADGQMYCSGIAPTGEYTMLDKIIEVAYNFELDADGFDFTNLDQGFRSWFKPGRAGAASATTEIFQPVDATKGETAPTQISKPVLLNGKGKPIQAGLITKNSGELVENPDGTPKGAEIKQFDQGKVFYLKYKTKKRVDFTPLGL